MAKDIFNNHNTEQCQKDEAPSIPDKGVTTGVSDTYGGGLEKGYQSENTIKPSNGGLNYA